MINLNDKINRSRPGQPPAPDLVRHARRCAICHHPERDLIEEAFVHRFHALRIVHDHKLPSRSAVYRHAYATGLYELRRRNLRYALEHLIEDATHAPVSGDCVIRAIRAYSRLTDDGRWVEPPQHIVVERRDAADPLVTRSHLINDSRQGTASAVPKNAGNSGVSTPEAHEVTGRSNNGTGSSHSPALRPSRRPNGSLSIAFLTGTPKQLETAATDTKQTIEAVSNRDKNTTIATADHESAGEPSREILFADVPRRRRIGRFLIETPKRLESAATETKQTIEVQSNRDKIAPPPEAN